MSCSWYVCDSGDSAVSFTHPTYVLFCGKQVKTTYIADEMEKLNANPTVYAPAAARKVGVINTC